MSEFSQSHGVLEILIISLMYIGRGSAGDDSPLGDITRPEAACVPVLCERPVVNLMRPASMPIIEMDGCDVMNGKAEFSKGREDTAEELAHGVVVLVVALGLGSGLGLGLGAWGLQNN